MAMKKASSKVKDAKAKAAQAGRLTKQAQSIGMAKVKSSRANNASSKRMTKQSKYNASMNYETGLTTYKKKTGR